MTSNLVGPIPEPDDLYGRDDEIVEAWRLLERHNLLMLGPRRFGKSGVLRHLKRKPQNGFLPISFDLEDVASGPEFVRRIIEKSSQRTELRTVLTKVGGVVGQFVDDVSRKVEEVKLGAGLPAIRLRQAIEQTDWETVARQVVHSLEQAETQILFLFDELPEMLKKLARAEGDEAIVRFLAWFRTVRLDDRDELRRHRFVVAGSTGLNYLLDRRLGCPEALNDFRRLVIEPIELPDAARLCRDLAASYSLTMDDTAIEHLLSRLGQPVPYFIQLFFSALAQTSGNGDRLTEQRIDQIYQSRLMGPVCKRYFQQYRRRLKQYEPAVEQAVISLLVEVACADSPVPVAELYDVYVRERRDDANRLEFSELLADLECDWYLQQDEQAETYSFYMNVMRDWWYRWYRSMRQVPQTVC